MILVGLIGTTKEKLSDSEQESIRNLWSEKKTDEIWKLLESKHAPLEWQELIKKEIIPLANDYLQNVVGVK